jgi:ABC-type antimicrobial peptide transport system permease subunit
MSNFTDENNPSLTSTTRIILKGNDLKHGNVINIVLINTTREKEIELGRNYPFHPLKRGECIIHETLKNSIINDTLLMIINPKEFLFNHILLNYYENEYNENINKISEINPEMYFNCKVIKVINHYYGKLRDASKNIIFMEMDNFFQHFSYFIPKTINELFPDYKKKLNNINPNHFATQLIVNFPKNRIINYIESDYHKLLKKAISFANNLVININSLGHMWIEMPLIRGMQRYNYGSVLLNLIFDLIIISLFILSLILIYSLLLITTETNSFEFGNLRLIGSTKKHIILIVILQCISFSVPAFILAFFLHFHILNLINTSLQNLIQTNLNLSYTTNSFFLAFCINFLSPITASILPIRSILRKNIATSLNTSINKTSGMKIEIISLEKKELYNFIILGLITFLYGASIYYFLPLSLISVNFSMLGGIFLWILFGILLGFVILSINIENILQKSLTKMLLFFTNSYTKSLIIKNLTAHRIKNRKTSIMYSLSIGVFIMISVGLNLIIQSSQKDIIMETGSEIVLKSVNSFFTIKDLYLDLLKMYKKNYIEYFSFKTPTITDLCFGSQTTIQNYGKSLEYETFTKGISPNYFHATEKEDLIIFKQNKNLKKYNPSEQLYFKDNIGKIGISALFNWEFKADLSSTILFNFKIPNNLNQMKFISKPAFLLHSGGGIHMSSVPSIFYQRTNIISIPLFIDIINKCQRYYSNKLKDLKIYFYNNFPIETINIKVNPNSDIKKSVDGIYDIIVESETLYFVWLFNNIKERIEIVTKIVYKIFYTVSAIVLFFCFFNLTASMTINIFEQKKEIAIMRTLGMKKREVVFIYICEAIVLILTSSFIGTIIGSLISYTMSLQWQMFTNVNVNFSIKISNIISIVLFSIIGGLFSTIIPSIKMLRTPISLLIKEI